MRVSSSGIKRIFPIFFVILAVIVTMLFFDRSSYERATGRINYEGWETAPRASDDGIFHYVWVEYEVNGEIYGGRLQIFTLFGIKQGDKITVYYKPSEPVKLFNMLQIYSAIGAMAALLFFWIGLSVAQKKCEQD